MQVLYRPHELRITGIRGSVRSVCKCCTGHTKPRSAGSQSHPGGSLGLQEPLGEVPGTGFGFHGNGFRAARSSKRVRASAGAIEASSCSNRSSVRKRHAIPTFLPSGPFGARGSTPFPAELNAPGGACAPLISSLIYIWLRVPGAPQSWFLWQVQHFHHSA